MVVALLWLLSALPAEASQEGYRPLRSLPSLPATHVSSVTRSNIEPSPTCSLCPEGGSAAFPETDVTSLLSQDMSVLLQVGETNSTSSNANDQVTCHMLNSSLSRLDAMEPSCRQIQQNMAGLCGCPPILNHCQFCTHLPFPNRTVHTKVQRASRPLTCQEMSLFLGQVSSTNEICRIASFPLAMKCGCEPTDMASQNAYAGASTEERRKAIVWVSRISAMIGGCGSSIIMWDIYNQKRKRKRAGNTEIPIKLTLLMCMSVFSFMLSITFALGSLPVPETEDGDSSFFWGAHGNDATCKAQGFFKQLGMTGFYYFVSLSVYYLLVIRHGWAETKIRRVRGYFHLPILVGVALALAGIPFYASTPLGCYFAGPPKTDSYAYLVVFNFVPLWTTVLLSTISLALVYVSVRKKERTVNRWRMRSLRLPEQPQQKQPFPSFGWRKASAQASIKGARKRKRSRMEKAVFHQCLSYFLATTVPATLTTFVILTADFFHGKENVYWLFIIFVAIAPSQGLLNLLVYFRPSLCATKRTNTSSGSFSAPVSNDVDEDDDPTYAHETRPSPDNVAKSSIEITETTRMENTNTNVLSSSSWQDERNLAKDNDENRTAELQHALSNGT